MYTRKGGGNDSSGNSSLEKSSEATEAIHMTYTHLLFGDMKRKKTQSNREYRYGNNQRIHWSVSQPIIELAGQGQAWRTPAC